MILSLFSKGRVKNVGGDFAPTEVGADYAGNKKGKNSGTFSSLTGHIYKHFIIFVLKRYWHERAAFQRSVFGQSTAGNDVVATKNNSFSFLFFSFFFSPSSTFLIEGVLGSKNLFSESCLDCPKT